MTSGTIGLGKMDEALREAVRRNGDATRVLQSALLTLAILDVCLTLGGNGSATLLATWVLGLSVTPGAPNLSPGPLLVLAAEGAVAYLACVDVLRNPATPFLSADLRSLVTLGPPRRRPGALTARRFAATRLPLLVACFLALAPSVGRRALEALAGLGLGAASGPCAVAATVVATWICAGLFLSATSDRGALAGVAAAAVAEGIAALQSPHGPTPSWASGLQLLVLGVLLTVAFSALVEGPRSRRIVDVVADATPLATFSPFQTHAPAPSYVRFAAGPSAVLVFARGRHDARHVAVDVRDDRTTVPVHDRALLVWNVGHLRDGLQGEVEATFGDLFAFRGEVGTMASTVGLVKHGDRFDEDVIDAASDMFFGNGDLRGLVRRAVLAAFETYVEGLGEGLAALGAEAEDDLAAFRAEAEAPAGTFDPLALGFALSESRRIQELVRPYLERQRGRETALRKLSGKLAGFAGPGSTLMAEHLAAALDERLARLGLGGTGARQATRIVEALDLQFTSARLTPASETLSAIAAVRDAGRAMQAMVDEARARVVEAGGIRSGQVGAATRLGIEGSVGDLSDVERVRRAFADGDAVTVAPRREASSIRERSDRGPQGGVGTGAGRATGKGAAPRQLWRDGDGTPA